MQSAIPMFVSRPLGAAARKRGPKGGISPRFVQPEDVCTSQVATPEPTSQSHWMIDPKPKFRWGSWTWEYWFLSHLVIHVMGTGMGLIIACSLDWFQAIYINILTTANHAENPCFLRHKYHGVSNDEWWFNRGTKLEQSDRSWEMAPGATQNVYLAKHASSNNIQHIYNLGHRWCPHWCFNRTLFESVWYHTISSQWRHWEQPQ